MRKILTLLTILCLLISVSACGENKNANTSNDSSNSTQKTIDAEYEEGDDTATIVVKDYGKIVVKLNHDQAPITVENFVKLAKSGFYDGLTFHRILPGFMIQGGDEDGDGKSSVNSNNTIKGEFSKNGVDNNISHTRGTLSMARGSSPDSAFSQFFIVHQDSTYLDGDYAAFGKVTKGMKAVDKICSKVKASDPASGLVEAKDQPVIETIKISKSKK